ncbi:MAG TPA: hypothetical protein VMT50_02690 [Steroidobacteraceae bacterium]|nr:hypothetical protein [Steroidobacteraceae bacterium]
MTEITALDLLNDPKLTFVALQHRMCAGVHLDGFKRPHVTKSTGAALTFRIDSNGWRCVERPELVMLADETYRVDGDASEYRSLSAAVVACTLRQRNPAPANGSEPDLCVGFQV